MSIAIRAFEEKDIPYKVKWINDDDNNKYLHYDLPLREDRTLIWFRDIGNRMDRLDLTITNDGEPAGLLGLLNIDQKNKKAEYYICLGGEKFRGRRIAETATKLLINKAYIEFGLNKIYLYTETGNICAQKFFEKIGFKKEGLLKNDLIHNGRKIDRYAYGMDVESFISEADKSNVHEAI